MTNKIKGKGGSGGGGAADSLFSTDWVELVLGVSEGPIKGIKDNSFKNIYINDTPHTAPDGSLNFEDSEFHIIYDVGVPDPEPIVYNMGGTSTTLSVGQELYKDTPVTKILPNGASTSFTQLEVRILVNQLVKYNDEGGQKTDVEFSIELKKESEGVWKPFIVGGLVRKIHGKTTQGVAYQYVRRLGEQVVLDGSDTYSVRVTKLTDDTTSKKSTDIVFASIDLVDTTDNGAQAHPDLAYVHFYGKLGEQITTTPRLTAVWQGLLCSVPSNYNSETREYTGTWDGVYKPVKEYTNNPFYVMRELALNPRIGLIAALKYLSVDDYEIYALAKHADEMVPAGVNGELQPRFTFNGVLDKAMDGIELINYIAGSAFARCYDDMNGKLRIIADRDDASVMLVVPESVIDSSGATFTYSKTDLRKRANVIRATYLDPDMNWEAQQLEIKDPDAIERFGRIQVDQQLVGCTNRYEAYRKLKYLLTTSQTEVISVSFTMPMSGILLEPYQIIDIADPDMGWALTGRVLSLNSRTLKLRDALTFDSVGTYTIKIQSATEGVVTRTFTISSPGLYNEFTLNSTVTETLNDYAPFSIESPANIGLSKPFRIMRIDEVSGQADVYAVTAMEVNRNKFLDSDNAILTDGAIPSPEYGFKAPIGIKAAKDIVVTSTRNKVNQLVDLYVTWTDDNISIFNRMYKVTLTKGGIAGWERTYTTDIPQIEIDAAPIGDLTITVEISCTLGTQLSEPYEFVADYLESEIIDLDWGTNGLGSISGGFVNDDLVFQASLQYLKQNVYLNMYKEPTIQYVRARVVANGIERRVLESESGAFNYTVAMNAEDNGTPTSEIVVLISVVDINGLETASMVSREFSRDGLPEITGLSLKTQPYGVRASIIFDEILDYPISANWYLTSTSGLGYTSADLVQIGDSLDLGSLQANTEYFLWVKLAGAYGDTYPKNLDGVAFTTPQVTSDSLGLELEKTVYSYLRADSEPSAPLGGSFTNPVANTNINNWSSAVPSENGLPLWVSACTFYLSGVSTGWGRPNLTSTPLWLTGDGEPADGLGSVFDSYLDAISGNIYKKTGVSTWTLQGNIRGGDGDSWYSGAGAPSNGTGTIGDYYLNTTNGDVYTKTGASAWTKSGNIKGVKGDTGTAGAVWYSGTTVPDSGTGSVGDFYINTATGDTYKKTSGTVWTLQGNIRGSDGDKWHSGTGAPAGVLGYEGDHYLNTTNGDVYDKTGASTWTLTGNIKGTKGDTGTAGAVWYSGTSAPASGLGLVNDFYINTATGDTYKKTSGTVWTLQGNIKGGDGDKWHSGTGGPANSLGVVGDHYLNTTNGDVYDKTGTSTWTLTGNIKGAKGDTGTAGAVWYTGTGVPASGTGLINDFYLNTATGDTYKKTSGTVWTLQGNIKGGDGDKWHSGTGTPANSLGVVGDHYLNTTNGDVYDKTGASTWSLTGNIKGTKGDTGTAGAVWYSGGSAPDSGIGKVGDFYLDTNLGNTYKKTGTSAWTLQGNLRGSDGDKWHSGGSAPSGSLGVIGDHYINLLTGDVYDKTGASTWVKTGNIKGVKGEDGEDGEDAVAFDPTFSKGLLLWSTAGNGEDRGPITGADYQVTQNGVEGGSTLRIDNNHYVFARYPIPVDVNKKYRCRFRVRQITDPTSGGAVVYGGVLCLKADLTLATAGVGHNRYAATNGGITITSPDWKEFTGIISGNVDNDHTTFSPDTKYVRPMCIVNNYQGDGTVEVDLLDFYEITKAEDLLVTGGWDTLPVEPADPRISNSFLQNQFSGTNLAKTATFTASSSITNVARLTDGDSSVGSSHAQVSSGAKYLQADFGDVRFIAQSWASFYSADGRTYKYAIATSIDGSSWEWAVGEGSDNGSVSAYVNSRSRVDGFSPWGAELPTITGVFNFARYVRLYMNDSTQGVGNHLYEWELWSSIPRVDPYPEQLASGLTTPLTTIPKAPNLSALALTVDRGLKATIVTQSNDDATRYELWRSIGGTSNWALIHSVAKQDVANGGTFTYDDFSYGKRATIYYKVYAVNRDTYSAASSNSFNVSSDIPDPTSVTMAVGSFEYALNWVNTTDTLLKSVQVKVEARGTNSGFNEANATVIYNGLGTSYTYEVPVGDRAKYHKFWLSSIENS